MIVCIATFFLQFLESSKAKRKNFWNVARFHSDEFGVSKLTEPEKDADSLRPTTKSEFGDKNRF